MFVRCIFPTADKAWQYDATASLQLGYPCWCTITFTDANGLQHATIERSCAFAWGRHIIGSGGAEGTPGAFYQMVDPSETAFQSNTYYGDCIGGSTVPAGLQGFPILRRRTSPHIFNSNKRTIYNMLDLGMLYGRSLNFGFPQVMVSFSTDGGNTFGTQRTMSMGNIGQYAALIRFRRFGYARDAVFDIQVADPVFACITNAELDVTVGAN